MDHHRGRRSRQEQVEQVIPLLRQERVVLEDCESFVDCRGVQALMAQLPRELLRRGTALSLLIQGAVTDVTIELEAADTPRETRLARFLHAYCTQHRTVVEIAAQLGLDRSHVSRTIRGPALALVARRFLDLVYQEDPLAESGGVYEALRTYEQRRARGRGHASRVTPHEGSASNPLAETQ